MKDKENKRASIVYRISKDMGNTFGDTITLHSFKDLHVIGVPSVAFSPRENGGNRTFLTWVDKSNPTKLDVYFSRNSDDGNRFEEPVIVSDDETGICSGSNSTNIRSFVEGEERTYDVMRSSIRASSDDNVYLMWVEIRTTGGAPKNAAKKAPTSISIDTSTAEGRKQYEDIMHNLPKYESSFRIFFRASTDGGRTFGRKINILNTKTSNESSPNAILPASFIASGNNVYIFIDLGGTQSDKSSVRFFRSTDKGATFEEKEIVQNANLPKGFRLVDARPMVVPMQPDSLYLVVTSTDWNFEEAQMSYSFPNPDFRHFMVKSLDAGNTFSKPVKLVDKMMGIGHSSFSVSPNGNNFYVAYADPGLSADLMFGGMKANIPGPESLLERLPEEDAGGDSILVRSSNDAGNNFSKPVRLKDSSNTGSVASMMTEILILPFGHSNVCVLRTRHTSIDSRDNNNTSQGYDSEVLLWNSINGGKSFEGPIRTNGEIRNSRAPRGIVIENNEDASKKQNGVPEKTIGDSNCPTLCLVWEAWNGDGYADVYFRRLTI